MSQISEPSKVTGKNTAKQPGGRKHNGSARQANTNPAKTAPEAASPVDERGDLLTEVWLRFSRFGWDVAGISLITVALVTLIGFLNRGLKVSWAQGFFISWWVSILSTGFGWGWPLVVLGLSILGLLCLRRRFTAWPQINLGRVLALEGLAFGLLALMSIYGGFSLDHASAGKDGGVIGWGLARLVDQALPLPWSAMLVVVVMMFLAGYGLGVFQWAHKHLLKWLDTVVPQAVPAQAVLPVSPAAPVQTDQARRSDLPPLDLLLNEQENRPDEEKIHETAALIEYTLSEFGVPAHVMGHRVGPTVTQFAVEPGYTEKPGPDGEIVRQKVRVSQISALSRDLALSLSAERLRIEAPVPGQSFVGIEVPNQRVSIVRLRSLLQSEAFRRLSSPLAVVFGRDVSGQPVVADLARMPHLLIAGTTGSGKSVCIASIVTCLVMNNSPEDLRMALLDPKMVELARFNGLPHLFGKVETEVDRMLGVLHWALMEMDRRYRLLEEARARDIFSYNSKMAKKNQPGLPRIVVLVDELADLMMTAPDQTEHSLIRLAQMARATGIHLVVATQRPSTDVVTGLIKANFPARLAFTVATSIDSRVILDYTGAETLLGKGDMLFLNPESGTPVRAQGALTGDVEVEKVIAYWREKRAGAASEAAPWEALLEAGQEDENADKLVEQAIKIVRQTQRASASLLQRRLRVGYPRAARLMDELEEMGVVGPSQGGGKERDVLLPPPGEGDDDDADGEA